MQQIKLATYSTYLATRQLAKQILKDIDYNNLPIIFDLEGVQMLTTNFADELFGKLFVEKGKVFKFKNVKDDFFKNIILQSIKTRQLITK
jgi:hypothetical protein